MKQIANAPHVAPSNHILWNIVATRSRTFLDTVQGKLRTSKPKKQNVNFVASLLQAR